MAFHSKKEFAKLCGLETNGLAVYIKRQKVVCSGEYIDDSFPVNNQFLKNRLQFLEQKSTENTSVVAENIIEPKQISKTEFATNHEPKKLPQLEAPVLEKHTKKLRKSDLNISAGINRFDLDNQIKLVELDKKTVETQLLRIKEEKLLGTVIPTESVKVLVTQFSKSIMSEFKNGTENILTKITAQANLNRNQVAELRAEFVEVINAAINASVDDAKKGLQNLVSEISLKKEVGERN